MKKLILPCFSIKSENKVAKKGFTLIELLVVIGILGILAASLIVTVDPFEQLKKAQDANVQNVTVEFNDALIRYYTSHNAMPWTVDTACGTAVGTTNGTTANVNLGAPAVISSCLSDLVSEGEVKSGFTTATNVLTSVIFQGTTNSVTACFHPQSKATERDLNTKYDPTALTITTGCISQTSTGVTTCLWCTQ